MRKTREELDVIKSKLNTDRLWSYSRINAYQTCTYSYYLKYIMNEKDTAEGVYLAFGNAIHDALEQFYKGEKPFEYIAEAFEDTKFKALMLAEMKFNNSDEEKNKSIQDKYLACLSHFAKHHKVMSKNVACEKFIMTKVENNGVKEYFMGYVDAMHYEKGKVREDGTEEDGILYITDYKTSTRYSGEKIKEHANQLILNAIGVSQETGLPLSRIKARWNFLKYLTVSYVQKNAKVKETVAERHNWVKKMENSLRIKMRDLNQFTDLEIEAMIIDSINANNIDNLPKSIQSAYTFDDAYVYVDLSEDNVKLINDEIVDICTEIRSRESDDEVKWHKEVNDKDSYYCSQLCGFRDRCPCYKEYLDNKNLFITTDTPPELAKDESNDWLKDLGIF